MIDRGRREGVHRYLHGVKLLIVVFVRPVSAKRTAEILFF
jgi:hypothetical protein